MKNEKIKTEGFKSRKRVKERGEVFTPQWLVKDMVDLVPDIDKPQTTVLEPACGTGNFLAEVLERKLKNSKSESERKISISSLFGIDIMEDNVRETRERLAGIFGNKEEAMPILENNIVVGNALTGKLVKDGKETNEWIWFLPQEIYKQEKKNGKRNGKGNF